jgi:hypothetical protein
LPSATPQNATSIKNVRPAEKLKRLFDGGGLYLEIASGGGTDQREKICSVKLDFFMANSPHRELNSTKF